MFNELSVTRGSTTAGVLPITYSELEAYQRVTSIALTPFDVALVRVADAAFLAEAHERATPASAEPTAEAAE